MAIEHYYRIIFTADPKPISPLTCFQPVVKIGFHRRPCPAAQGPAVNLAVVKIVYVVVEWILHIHHTRLHTSLNLKLIMITVKKPREPNSSNQDKHQP